MALGRSIQTGEENKLRSKILPNNVIVMHSSFEEQLAGSWESGGASLRRWLLNWFLKSKYSQNVECSRQEEKYVQRKGGREQSSNVGYFRIYIYIIIHCRDFRVGLDTNVNTKWFCKSLASAFSFWLL